MNGNWGISLEYGKGTMITDWKIKNKAIYSGNQTMPSFEIMLSAFNTSDKQLYLVLILLRDDDSNYKFFNNQKFLNLIMLILDIKSDQLLEGTEKFNSNLQIKMERKLN